MAPLPKNVPRNGQIFRHVDGGYYEFLSMARHTDTTEAHYIYVHLWPFIGDAPWARPASEWDARFKQVSREELALAKQGNREEAQRHVVEAKAARRAAKGQ